MTEREKEIVEIYRTGLTLRQAGLKLGISMQRVHQTVKKHAPELMRPKYNRYHRLIQEDGSA